MLTACGVLLAALILSCGAAPRVQNLLIISVDTLRADHLGCYGRNPSFTPNLDAFAAEGDLFLRAYSPAPFTTPSIAALLTGHAPETVGMTGNEVVLARGVQTLAMRLQANGFQTAAIVSNYVLSEKTGLNQGFESYDHELVWGKIPERNATQTTDAALARLKQLRSDPAPFFLWVHYMDPHVPYHPPSEFVSRHLETERNAPGGRKRLEITPEGQGGIPKFIGVDQEREVGFYRAAYAGEVEYVDVEIGRLLEGLSGSSTADDTIVVFVADHGESLGEDDLWFTHGHYLSDALVRVPLMLRTPGRSSRLRDDVVSLLDIAPTVLARLNVPSQGLAGRDVLAKRAEDQSSDALMSNYEQPGLRLGLAVGEYKYIIESRRGRKHEYVLRTDLFGEEAVEAPERIPEMRARMKRLRAKLQPAVLTPQVLSDQELEALRALGYAQ